MAYGAAPFGFDAPLSDDPDAIRRLLLGGQGFNGPPTMDLPAQPTPDLAVRPAPFGFGPVPGAGSGAVASAGHPFDPGAATEQPVVPLPPARPSDDELAVAAAPPQPRPTFGFGRPQVPTAQADAPAPGAQPAVAPGFAPPQAAPAPQSTAPTGAEPSFGDRFLSGLKRFQDAGGGDLLTSLGIGLLSTPGFGQGLAAGLLNHQQQEKSRAVTSLAQNEALLKRAKLARELGGDNETVQFLIRQGYSPQDAQSIVAASAAGNSTALNNAMSNAVPKATEAPSGYRANPDGSVSFLPGGPADPATIAAQTAARASDEPQLVDVPQPDGSVQKVWMRKGEADGTAVGAAKRAAPIVKEFEGADGVKRPYMQDPTTQQWREMQLPNAGPAGNPYATGRFNNEQGKAAGFSDRMMGSERVLRNVEGVNTTPGASNIAGSQFYPNAFKSSDRQKLEQAQRDFVNAQLRRESGAAISPSEFDNARQQYFPQPGDGADVIAQKRLARQRAIEAMGREGGPSYRPGYVFDPKGNITPYQSGGMANRSAIEAEMRRRGLQP